MITRIVGSLAAAACLGALLTAPASAATVTWVSGVGDDANPCSSSAPCKTFAGAISKTEPGGVIRVLNAGGYGPLTITKSITIDASGVFGSVLTSPNGFTIKAGPTDRVSLINLDIFSAQSQSATCGPTQQAGIRIESAGTVTIQNTRINLSAAGGVLVVPTANPVDVNVIDSAIRNSCGSAVRVAPAPGVTARANIIDSTLTLNAVGVSAATGGTVRLQGSTLFGNTAATQTTGGTIDLTDPTNRIVGNDPVSNPVLVSNFSAASRVWVSGNGDDANPCSRTAPCRTLAGAYAKVASGGQINVMEPVSLGTLTMTKPVTVDGSGSQAAIYVSSGSGITVDVNPGEAVVLRDLRIIGSNNGAAGCSYPASAGVRVLGARSLHLENSTISGFGAAGVDVVTASNVRVVVDGSTISNVCGSAVRLAPAGGAKLSALIARSSLVSNGASVSAGSDATAWLTKSYLAANAQAAAGSVTVLPDTVEVTKEVVKEVIKEVPVTVPVTTVAQVPVACKKLPKVLKPKRTTVLLNNTCVTTGGQRVGVTVTGRGKLLKGRGGKVSVRTKKKGKVTVTFAAAATPAFLPFSVSKTYKL